MSGNGPDDKTAEAFDASQDPAVKAVVENVKNKGETLLRDFANLEAVKEAVLQSVGLPNNAAQKLQQLAADLEAVTKDRDAKAGELTAMTTARDNLQTSLEEAEVFILGLNQGMDRLEEDLGIATGKVKDLEKKLEEAKKPKKGKRTRVDDDEDPEDENQGKDYLWFLKSKKNRSEEEDD